LGSAHYVLHAAHHYCERCLAEVIDTAAKAGRPAACPQCRHTIRGIIHSPLPRALYADLRAARAATLTLGERSRAIIGESLRCSTR
jgi:hypothetical protein